MCLCDSVVCRRESERWCWCITLVGVRRRKCYVTRVRFVGLRGTGVSAAAGVWAAGDRDVAVRGVLFAGAVGGGDSR